MEYHNSKDATIAGKVFSLGQKIFADDPDFVCQYLDFLIQMNDDNNTRALFERTLATMPAGKSFPVWEKFLDYENKYGDLAGVHNVEKRRMEAISTSNPMESFLKRHSYLDIQNIEENELGNKGNFLNSKYQWQVNSNSLSIIAREQIAAEAATTANPEQVLPPNIVATERSTARESVKRPLLEPVHPERYARPDFSQWQPFKPSADANRRAPGPNNPPPPIPPPMQPAAPDVKPTPEPMMPTASPMLNTPSPAVPMPPVPPVSAPPGWNKGPTLPEAVAYFVNNLPPAQTFNGPLIQPGELVDLLRNIIIPIPPQGAAPPPPRPMQKNTGPNMHPSNRDSRGNFSNRGRGGFKPRVRTK
jgi:hypothetical protein